MDSETRLYRLDHLRLMAATMVIIWHFSSSLVGPSNGWFSIIQQGYTGVSLFCVISGFIFTWIYLDRTLSVKEFFINRALRLLPMFFLVLILAFYSAPGSDALKILGTITTTLFTYTSLPTFSNVGWTILVEAQFYVMFPLLIPSIRKYGVPYLVGLVIIFVVLRGMLWINQGHVRETSYLSIGGRIDQFGLGALAAYIFCRVSFNRLARCAQTIVTFASIIALLLAFSKFMASGGMSSETSPNDPVWIYMPTIEGLAYASLLLAYLSMPPVPGRIASLIERVFRHGGRVSYSMYLIHVLVIGVILQLLIYLDIKFMNWTYSAMFALVVVTPTVVIISTFTFFAIEKPAMDLRRPRSSLSLSSPAERG